MSWKFEIFRALFVAFGMFEIITNTSFLCLKNGLKFAAKQHGEIPKSVTRRQLTIKVILMLSFGTLFFIIGVYSYISRNVNETYYLASLALLASYAAGEAIYYRYWKTCGFSILSIIVLLCFVI